MRKTIDETVVAGGYLVQRSGNRVTVARVPKKDAVTDVEEAKRIYKTEHGAVCALARVNSDASFAETLHKSMLREALGGKRRVQREKNPKVPRLGMEHLVVTSLNRLHALDEEVPFSNLIVSVTSDATKALKAGKPLTGIGLVRSQLGMANKKLTKA